MKKVVLNRAIGGFQLSGEAIKWLVENGDPQLTYSRNADDEINGPLKHIFQETCYDVGDGYMASNTLDWVVKDGRCYSFWDTEENREHPDLIECVEKFGRMASSYVEEENGEMAFGSNIKIVEIPEDTEYYIDDNQGWEVIHEKHETW